MAPRRTGDRATCASGLECRGPGDYRAAVGPDVIEPFRHGRILRLEFLPLGPRFFPHGLTFGPIRAFQERNQQARTTGP